MLRGLRHDGSAVTMAAGCIRVYMPLAGVKKLLHMPWSALGFWTLAVH